jgi:hypothetical protein
MTFHTILLTVTYSLLNEGDIAEKSPRLTDSFGQGCQPDHINSRPHHTEASTFSP